jgi:hypothetical protein
MVIAAKRGRGGSNNLLEISFGSFIFVLFIGFGGKEEKALPWSSLDAAATSDHRWIFYDFLVFELLVSGN